jgi:glycosyltransferase involved in cell wall biosynthesis
MIAGRTVSLVIPAHNEEAGLPRVLESVPEGVDEVIVVDNASTDGTSAVAASYGARVVLQPEKGYGSAYMAGLPSASGQIIATADADGTYPVELLPFLVERLESDGMDFISARRVADDKAGNLENALRFGGNAMLTLWTVILFWKLIRDSQSGMWVFRREVVDRLHMTSRGMPFSEEIKIEAWRNRGLRCCEIPIPFSYSTRLGTAKLRLWRDGFRNLLFLFAKRLRIPMTGA